MDPQGSHAGGRMLLLRGKGAPLLATPKAKDADGNQLGAELDGFGFAHLEGKWVWAAQGLE